MCCPYIHYECQLSLQLEICTVCCFCVSLKLLLSINWTPYSNGTLLSHLPPIFIFPGCRVSDCQSSCMLCICVCGFQRQKQYNSVSATATTLNPNWGSWLHFLPLPGYPSIFAILTTLSTHCMQMYSSKHQFQLCQMSRLKNNKSFIFVHKHYLCALLHKTKHFMRLPIVWVFWSDWTCLELMYTNRL